VGRFSFRSVSLRTVDRGSSRAIRSTWPRSTPELTDVAKQIGAKEAILDGEIVALDKDGMPRFQLLQPRVGRKSGIEALRARGISSTTSSIFFTSTAMT